MTWQNIERKEIVILGIGAGIVQIGPPRIMILGVLPQQVVSSAISVDQRIKLEPVASKGVSGPPDPRQKGGHSDRRAEQPVCPQTMTKTSD